MIQVVLLSSISVLHWWKSSLALSRKAILFSKSCSLSVVLRFLAAAKLRDFLRTLSLIISQSRAGFIDSSFLYSSCVCAIVCFIRLMYSVSDRSDVLSFQNPGPVDWNVR